MRKEKKDDFSTPPKWLCLLIIIFIILVGLFGCKAKTIYVPVESSKNEYNKSEGRDSVYIRDSIYFTEYKKGDTVYQFMYKDRYYWKDKIVKDSIYINDTIRVTYPVDVEKEVNRLTSFQSFQVWCGRILLLILLGWFGFKIIKNRFT
ncbi:hypothetical protein [Dysgonomonas sp. 511]|uniref:hypothetical protein n=1 Tax=Dysgonomonas sp. 511 TaxID=2302930 RepID=UPI002105175A|nr:hypothetical protein [Dysgonomonas sp. 511]